MTTILTIKCNNKVELLLQPVEVGRHSLVTAVVSTLRDDAPQ